MVLAIFWVLVLLFTLSYFGTSVQSIIDSPTLQANLSYLLHFFSQ